MTRPIAQPVNPMRQPATVLQRRAFDFIVRRWIDERPASTTDLAIGLDLTYAVAAKVVNALRRKGWAHVTVGRICPRMVEE